jgi:superfamily II DNA or RNA helicase
MIITISNNIHLPMTGIRPGVAHEIKRRLTFKNPAYGEALGRLRAMGRDGRPYNIPEEIRGWRESNGHLILPRGCAADIQNLLTAMDIEYEIQNRTRKLPEVNFLFLSYLRAAQEPAVSAILSRRFGTICSPTGSGKTVMGLYCIAQRRQPALVVVHTTALLKQWIDRAVQFLGLDPGKIGIIGQGSRTVGKRLTVALVQTLRKCAADIAPRIGHLIVDECHHQAASTYTEAVAPFDAAYALGLSATHKRRDGLTLLIYWYVGPLVYEVARSTLVRDGDIIQVEPVIRETEFSPSPEIDPTWQRAALMKELCEDDNRTARIANDVIMEVVSGGSCIVLSDRKSHCYRIAEMISWFPSNNIQAEVCTGDTPKPEQEAMIQAMNDGRLQVLVATGQLLGEGFDCKGLTALFLATPIKWEGRLVQFLGRVARSAEGKTTAKVYDYVDSKVPVLMKAYRSRARTYKKLAKLAQGPTPKEK